jgi:hypothetical protein
MSRMASASLTGSTRASIFLRVYRPGPSVIERKTSLRLDRDPVVEEVRAPTAPRTPALNKKMGATAARFTQDPFTCLLLRIPREGARAYVQASKADLARRAMTASRAPSSRRLPLT